MEQNNRSGILRRIRGLMAKTTGNGCTESEALAAASLLAKLVDKYGFTPIDMEEPLEKLTETLVSAKGASPSLRFAMAVAAYCDCKVFNRKSTNELVFFGQEVDSLLAGYLMSLLSHANETGWKAYLKAERAAGLQAGKSSKQKTLDRVSYNLGFGRTVTDRLRDMKVERSATVDTESGRAGGALVLVKNAVVTEEYAKRYATKPARRTRFSYQAESSAYGAGQSNGRNVAINAGIGAHSTRAIA